jgi:hypothetical protein
VAKRSVDWWLTAEDLPNPNNRVSLVNGQVYLDYIDNNTQAFDRLLHRWTEVLKSIDCTDAIVSLFSIFSQADSASSSSAPVWHLPIWR